METITLDVTEFANGGYAVGRASRGRTVFVPLAIAGEKVRVTIHTEKNKYAYAHLEEVLRPSADRVAPQCPHFGMCGGCHWQHMSYAAQLRAKEAVIADQLERIGGIKQAPIAPAVAYPEPWAYRQEIALSPVEGGGLGYWSPVERRVFAMETCAIARPELLTLLQDIDLDLPGLRKLTLRVGEDGDLLAAMEVDDVEPPELEADFPIAVAIVLPDKTAVTLVGDNFTIHTINGRDFRVSAGCQLPADGLLVDEVLRCAALQGTETVLELYSGVGTLTAFLADAAAEVVAIEMNPDAVADTAVNVDAENVSLYEGLVDEILPDLSLQPDVVVVHPGKEGVSRAVLQQIVALRPLRLVYASSDIATFARDAKQLHRAGYKLAHIQPIDLRPQTFHIDLVGLWLPA